MQQKTGSTVCMYVCMYYTYRSETELDCSLDLKAE